MKYWIMLNGVRLGPLTIEELRALPVKADTPVWRTGMAEWTTAGCLPELAELFASNPGEMPPPLEPRVEGPTYTVYTTAPGAEPEKPRPPRPANYQAWAIVVLILCNLVTGVIALIYSSRVNECYDRGEYDEAVKASSNTLTWIWISVAVGLLCCGGYGLLALAENASTLSALDI